jgi:predicted alpha/beta hydrolase family esterase
MRISTIPGIFGSDANHWQTRWEQKYGFKRIEQDNWNPPVYHIWEQRLLEYINRNPQPKSHILVAHSRGCLLTIKALHIIQPFIKGIFLVAPPDLRNDAQLSQFNTFDTIPLHRLNIPGYIVYSENDRYASPAFAERLGRIWGFKASNVGQRGHINSKSRLGDWDEGYELFREFAETLPPCQTLSPHPTISSPHARGKISAEPTIR